ncbi:hypothetical protein E2C01_051416 [Portunus trituberculatus]|uniref:Uncharacterized protein n=1 Tax=Portunus trituberculatus TaxID=210409 RepID=A0A5B7GIN2_PORTR|nr:hypothetical protein [Portunus trituberculatus]
MVVSQSPAAKAAIGRRLSFGGAALPLQEDIKIMGVDVDRGLRFDSHVKTIAKKVSHRISALRKVAGFLNRIRRLLLYKVQDALHCQKVAGFLNRIRRLLLYKVQVWTHLEYTALSRMPCTATHRRRLDSIQHRTLLLVDAAP